MPKCGEIQPVPEAITGGDLAAAVVMCIASFWTCSSFLCMVTDDELAWCSPYSVRLKTKDLMSAVRLLFVMFCAAVHHRASRSLAAFSLSLSRSLAMVRLALVYRPGPAPTTWLGRHHVFQSLLLAVWR